MGDFNVRSVNVTDGKSRSIKLKVLEKRDISDMSVWYLRMKLIRKVDFVHLDLDIVSCNQKCKNCRTGKATPACPIQSAVT